MRLLGVALAIAVLGTSLLVSPWTSPVSAENPSNSNVYGGDACGTFVGPLGTRDFAVRLANDAANCQHRTWEIAPGGSFTLYWRTWTSGTVSPALPNGDSDDVCRIRLYYDAGTVVHQTLRSATTCNSDGTSYTGWCTDNGASGGTPIAGTLRIRVEVESRTLGVLDWSKDTDADRRGAIRCGMDVPSITINSYPAGSTFSYTVAGETMTCTIAHTKAEANQVRTANVALLDGGDAAIQTNSLTITSGGTSTASSFTVSDTYPAASTNAGCQLAGFGNSALSGVKWTHINTATSPVTKPNDATARRSTFFNVDPRITATHLLLLDDNTFGTPPMSEDAGMTRTNTYVGRIATRFTNARSEGLSGASFLFSQSIQDTSATLPASTITAQTVSTQGGQAGWGPLQLWNDGAPTGSWTKTVDITGPATIDNNAHLLVATATYTLEAPEAGSDAFPGDPLHALVIPDQANVNQTVRIIIAASNLDGSARTGATVLVDVWNDAHTQLVTGGTTTEVGTGYYRYDYTAPSLGRFSVRVRTTDTLPAATATGFYVQPVPEAFDMTNITALITNGFASLTEHRTLSPEYTAAEAQESWITAVTQIGADFAWLLVLVLAVGVAMIPNRFVRLAVVIAGSIPILLLPLSDTASYVTAGALAILFIFNIAVQERPANHAVRAGRRWKPRTWRRT